MGKKYFTVEEVALSLNLSRQTVIRYEKKGIFPKPLRNPINKWRQYTTKDIEKLKKICQG